MTFRQSAGIANESRVYLTIVRLAGNEQLSRHYFHRDWKRLERLVKLDWIQGATKSRICPFLFFVLCSWLDQLKDVERKRGRRRGEANGAATERIEEKERRYLRKEPGVSPVLLSRGDLILIYSRVPNKLVFAVVTSALFPPRCPPPLLLVPRVDQETSLGPRGVWTLITLLSRARNTKLPLTHLGPLLFPKSARSALRAVAAASPRYTYIQAPDRTRESGPCCTYLLCSFFPFASRVSPLVVSKRRRKTKERRRERTLGVEQRRARARNTLASTPVAYNCQLARGYLIAIRLGGGTDDLGPAILRPDLGPLSPSPPLLLPSGHDIYTIAWDLHKIRDHQANRRRRFVVYVAFADANRTARSF